MDETMELDQTKWKFKQCFGEHRSLKTIQEGDMLTSVEFSDNGDYIATGDRAGRVVIFEQNFKNQSTNTQAMEIDETDSLDDYPWFSLARERYKRSQASRRSISYKFSVEFQSHNRGFDSLKSIEIDERINKIRFCNQRSDALMLLTTNDKTIKLWKVSEKMLSQVVNFNFERDSNTLNSSTTDKSVSATTTQTLAPQKLYLQVPKITKEGRTIRTQQRKVYENGHSYNINGLSVNCDGMSFMSSDDLKINFWDLDRPNEVYNVVDITPENMDKLVEVITCCATNPTENNIFVYASSRGALKLHDLRVNSNCDKLFKVYYEDSDLYHNWVLGTGDCLDDQANSYVQQNSKFFSDVLASISDVSFINNGRNIISRDYLTVKIWDIRKEDKPTETINFLEHLKPNLKNLYLNEYIFDKFEVTTDNTGNKIATGTYNNCFFVFDKETQTSTCVDVGKASHVPGVSVVKYLGGTTNLVQHDINVKIDPPPPVLPIQHTPNIAISANSNSQNEVLAEQEAQQQMHEMEERLFDHKDKALHLALHPNMDCAAVAVENNLFVFGSV